MKRTTTLLMGATLAMMSACVERSQAPSISAASINQDVVSTTILGRCTTLSHIDISNVDLGKVSMSCVKAVKPNFGGTLEQARQEICGTKPCTEQELRDAHDKGIAILKAAFEANLRGRELEVVFVEN
jgi:hypothetical protein